MPHSTARLASILMVAARHAGPALTATGGPDPFGVDEAVADPASGSPERLATDLEGLGATFVKLGQLMSTRYDLLPAPYTEALQRLQDGVEPFAIEDVHATIEADLGARTRDLYSEFDEVPLASASIGQVHRAVTRSGRDVVVKVQRPGVREQVRADMEALDQVDTCEPTPEATRRALHGFVDAYLSFCLRHPEVPALWMRRWLSEGEDIQAIEDEFAGPLVARVSTRVRAVLDRAGLTHEIDLEMLVYSIVWTTHSFSRAGFVDATGERRLASSAEMRDRFRRHLHHLVGQILRVRGGLGDALDVAELFRVLEHRLHRAARRGIDHHPTRVGVDHRAHLGKAVVHRQVHARLAREHLGPLEDVVRCVEDGDLLRADLVAVQRAHVAGGDVDAAVLADGDVPAGGIAEIAAVDQVGDLDHLRSGIRHIAPPIVVRRSGSGRVLPRMSRRCPGSAAPKQRFLRPCHPIPWRRGAPRIAQETKDRQDLQDFCLGQPDAEQASDVECARLGPQSAGAGALSLATLGGRLLPLQARPVRRCGAPRGLRLTTATGRARPKTRVGPKSPPESARAGHARRQSAAECGALHTGGLLNLRLTRTIILSILSTFPSHERLTAGGARAYSCAVPRTAPSLPRRSPMSTTPGATTQPLAEVQVGVIGGSGLYEMEGLTDVTQVSVETPYGMPSDDLVIGTLDGVRVAFLPRHGRGHRLSPSELPSRANVYALRALGATYLVSISAVGSLREDLAPCDVVIPDQLLDRTKGVRPASFFGDGVVVHVAFAEPFCPELSAIVAESARRTGARLHVGGTLVVMEGPQFSTKAESHFYRQIGAHLIGMTALPEAKLAREAEMCYCTLAMVTDYDCWHEAEESVTADLVVANVQANVAMAQEILRDALPRIVAAERSCACSEALANALMTRPDAIPPEKRQQVDLFLGKYLS